MDYGELMGFEWINDLIQAILKFVPRPVIIKATHGGVKWQFGSKVVEMKPGWHWWWPLVTEVSIIVTARQTLNTNTQALLTKDRQEVVCGGVLVYRIPDVKRAIGQRNWDVDTTVHDIAQAAIVEVITQWNFNDLLREINGKVKDQLTAVCRKELRQFGVYVHKAALNDFSTCNSINVLGISKQVQTQFMGE